MNRRAVAATMMVIGGLFLILGDGVLLSKLGLGGGVAIFRPTIYVQEKEEEAFAKELIASHTDEIKGLADEVGHSLVKAADEADKTPAEPPEKVFAFFRTTAQDDMGPARWLTFAPIMDEANRRLKDLRAAEKIPNCANAAILFRAWARGWTK